MLSRKQWKSLFVSFANLKKKKNKTKTTFESVLVNKQSNTPAFHGWQSPVLWPCPSGFPFWNLSFPIYSADDNTSYTGLLGRLNGMFVKSTRQSDWYLEVTPLPLNSKVKVQRLLNHTVSNTVRTHLVNRLTVTVHDRQSHHLASPNSPKQFPLSYLKLKNNNNNNKKKKPPVGQASQNVTRHHIFYVNGVCYDI